MKLNNFVISYDVYFNFDEIIFFHDMVKARHMAVWVERYYSLKGRMVFIQAGNEKLNGS